MNISITGGAVYIGSHIYVALQLISRQGVIIVDNLCNSQFDAIDGIRN